MKITLVCFLLMASSACATNYYVRTDGTNTNNGLTDNAAGAWLTVQKAADTIQAGDTAYIRTGTFAEEVHRNNDGDGTSGNRVVFDGGGVATVEQWKIQDDDYITVQGFRITDTDLDHDAAIYLSNADHALVQNNYIYDYAAIGILGRGAAGNRSNDVTVHSNHVYQSQMGIVIYSDAGSTNAWTVTSNHVEAATYLRGEASDTVGDCDGMRVLTGDGHVLRYNWVEGATAESSQGEFWGTHTGGNNAAALVDSAENLPVDAYVGDTIKNQTDGSSGVILSNSATTIWATLSGGTDDDWDTGDEWAASGGPHIDGIQIFDGGATDAPVASVTFEHNIILDVTAGIQMSNTKGGNGNYTIRSNVFARPIAAKYNGYINGNAPLSVNDLEGTNIVYGNTMDGFTFGALFDSGSQNVYFSNNVVRATYSSPFSYAEANGCLGDYNLASPAGGNATNANDVIGTATFIDSSDPLGADGLPFTANDGFNLTAGSAGVGAASDGGDIGAYQRSALVWPYGPYNAQGKPEKVWIGVP